MLGTMRRVFSAVTLALALAASPACDLFLGNSKIEHGELYQSGDPRYDRFFAEVHDKQVAAESWDDDKKSSRAPLVKALGLTETAGQSRILNVLKTKKDEVAGPAAQTANAEAARSRKLAKAADALEALSKKGAELKEEAAEDKKNMGAEKADDKKVKERDTVRREVAGATRVCTKLASRARSEAKEADELVEAIKQAVPGVSVSGGGAETPAPSPPDDASKPKPAAKPKPAGKPKPATPKPATPKPDAPKPDAPKPDAPKPPPAEVFDP